MPRVCHFTGARTTVGRRIRYRGKPKYLGGIGLNITSITKRKFRPNIQSVRALVDGKPVRLNVSAKAIRNGFVVKPLKRKYGYTRQQKLANGG
jgi:large subunit ribosomal protein L28